MHIAASHWINNQSENCKTINRYRNLNILMCQLPYAKSLPKVLTQGKIPFPGPKKTTKQMHKDPGTRISINLILIIAKDKQY